MNRTPPSQPVQADPAAMPDRRELALLAVERARMPMVVTDPRQPDNPIVLANQAFLELTGYRADEVVGRNCRFLQGPDTAPADVAAIHDRLAAGEDQFTREILNYRKNGSSFWNQMSVSPVLDADGDVLYHFGSQKDITAERGDAPVDATERRLLMEVDHRAMNALALVQSIVRQTRADDPAEFAQRVQARVDAIAQAHRLLAQARWRGVDAGDLVRLAIASHDGAVRASGPAVTLPARLVQPLAVVLHELMCNAVRHGALAAAGGRVDIAWQPASDPEAITIRWSETGGRAVTGPPPRTGFGLAMVDGILRRQLGGTVALDWNGPGLRAEMTLPFARQ